MKSKKKNLKDYAVDITVCMTAAMLTIAIFGFYFYNVFIKFQVDYAHLFNDNVLSKSTELHNDIITVSNSLFTNSDVNAFLSEASDSVDINSMEYIDGCIQKSTISDYISNVIISIPKSNSIYSAELKKKISCESFFEKFPETEKIIKNQKGAMSITNEGDCVFYAYKHYNGNLIVSVIRNETFKNKIMGHVYPIFYGTVLFNSDESPIVSNMTENIKELFDTASDMESNSVKIKGNYFIIKDSTSLYSTVSIIRISDMLSTAVDSGTFLLVVLLLICMFIFVIMYYFYFRHKKVISDNHILKKDHLNTNINRIIQKIFSHDILTKQDVVSLNEYFSLNNGVCFVPILVGIENYKDLIGELSYDDLSMYKYGFENIISEVFSENAEAKTVNMGKEFIGVLLYKASSFNLSVLKEKIRYIENVIRENFNTGLFFVVGEETEEIMSVYEQIPQLINVQNYRFISDSNEIFLSKTEKKDKDLKYPIFIQTEIISSITTGNPSAFRISLEKFADYITKNECSNGKEWFLKLFLAISESCQSSSSFSVKYNTLESMLECDKITQMTDMLANSVEYTLPAEAKNEEDAEKDFVKSITKIIEKEFSNPSFCIQNVTSYFGITAAYFGKKFKQNFGTSFNHYLLNRRLNHAVKLLSETTYTNERIAQECGFNSRTYFMTIFKKTFGVSPKEYKTKKE